MSTPARRSASSADPDCIFCKIIAGDLPSRRIYEDDHAIAFLDIAAWHRGHTLVVPKRHVADMITGTPSLPEIASSVDAVARMLMHRLAADGMNIFSSARESPARRSSTCTCTWCRGMPTSPVWTC